MKPALVVLVLAVAGVVGLGFYLGWFHLSSGSSADAAHVTVSMDKGQMQEDKDRAVDQTQDLGQPAKEEVATTTEKAQGIGRRVSSSWCRGAFAEEAGRKPEVNILAYVF